MADQAATLEIIALELSIVLDPLQVYLLLDNAKRTLAEIGVILTPAQVSAISGPLQNTVTRTSDVSRLAGELATAIKNNQLPSIVSKSAEIIGGIKAVIDSFDDLASAIEGLGLPGMTGAVIEQIPERIFNFLFVRRLDRMGALNELLEFFGILEREEHNQKSSDPDNPPFVISTLHFDKISDWLNSPGRELSSRYKWGDSGFDGILLLRAIEKIIAHTGIPVFFDETVSPPTLDVVLIEISPKTDISPRGLAVALKTNLNAVTQVFSQIDWRLEFKSDFQIPFNTLLIVQPDGNLSVQPPQGSEAIAGDLDLRVIAEKSAPPEPIIVLGQASGIRIEIGEVRLGISPRFSWDAANNQAKTSLTLEGEVKQGKFIISFSSDLLAEIIPGKGLQTDFELALGWSSERGFFFKGSAGLETVFAIHKTIGPFRLETLHLALRIAAQGLQVEASVTGSGKFGPVTVTVERIGISSSLEFRRGNLGPTNFALDFKPPDGLGLVIDGGGFKGGGFLSHDSGPPDKYFGALLLKAQKLSISAFGIFEKSPSGTSFAIILGARFTPGIELGFGFSLVGVGGVIGINRRIDVDALRERLSSGTAGNLFFTDDPVANAPRLLGDIQQIMPAAEGVYTFGPTLRITWLKKAIFDVAILIELPGPSKVVLVGVARMKIGGDEENGIEPILKLRIDLLGVIDFTKKHIQFDATILDSTLMQVFKLSGDAALQLDAGDRPYAMLAIGGFHPAFKPEPAVFRKLNRITGVYAPARASKFSLSMAGYLAVTSNTFQLGAKITAKLSAGSISVEGELGFDALIQFEPFHFVIDFSAKVRVKAKGHNVGGISFKGTITGPGPVVISGKFCIEILFFDFCWKGSFQIGDEAGETPAVVASLRKALKPELEDLTNLQAIEIDDLLAVSNDQTTSGKFPAAQHLNWSQKKAPLEFTVTRFAGQPLSSPQAVQFKIESSATFSPIEDWFSPGSFMDLTQSQALNLPAFQRKQSGKTFDLGMISDIASPPHTVSYDVKFLPERSSKGTDDEEAKLKGTLLHPETLIGAVSGRTAALRVFTADPVVKVADERWEVRDASGALIASQVDETEAHQRAALVGATALPAGDVVTLNGVF